MQGLIVCMLVKESAIAVMARHAGQYYNTIELQGSLRSMKLEQNNQGCLKHDVGAYISMIIYDR